MSATHKTIQVKTETHKRLTGLAAKGDSYNDVIERLLDEHAKEDGRGE